MGCLVDLQDHMLLERPNLTGSQASEAARTLFGVSGEATPFQSERDQNFHLRCSTGEQFVLKIANAAEEPAVLEFQNRVLENLRQRDPALPVPKVQRSLRGELTAPLHIAGIMHLVRLVSFMPGRPLPATQRSEVLQTDLGEL